MHGYASGPTAADADVVGKRVGAAIADSIIGFALYFVLAGTILGGGLSSGSVLMAFFVLPFAVFVGYYIVFEGMFGSATPGKRLFGIEVVKESGGAIDAEDALVRNAFRFVDGICYYAVGFVFMATSDRKQRLGDRVASTVVVASSATHGTGNRHPHRGRPQQGAARARQRDTHSHRPGGQTGQQNQQRGRGGQQPGHRGHQTTRTSGRQHRATTERDQQQPATQHRQHSGSRRKDQQRATRGPIETEDASSRGADYRPERNSGASS